MSRPEEIARQVEAAQPGWLVLWGQYSQCFWAIPGPHYRRLDSGIITASNPADLQRRMAYIDANPNPAAPPSVPHRHHHGRATGRSDHP
ncbi:hypothetical protein ACFQ07_34325 [Actinomadura adrarensis]|uniref:Uncharacterized protein n=1 Tax=Actinomadura adrarensis TaxID=1819600 RepID=A0ABW3CRY5_9ACTN